MWTYVGANYRRMQKIISLYLYNEGLRKVFSSPNLTKAEYISRTGR